MTTTKLEGAASNPKSGENTGRGEGRFGERGKVENGCPRLPFVGVEMDRGKRSRGGGHVGICVFRRNRAGLEVENEWNGVGGNPGTQCSCFLGDSAKDLWDLTELGKWKWRTSAAWRMGEERGWGRSNWRTGPAWKREGGETEGRGGWVSRAGSGGGPSGGERKGKEKRMGWEGLGLRVFSGFLTLF